MLISRHVLSLRDIFSTPRYTWMNTDVNLRRCMTRERSNFRFDRNHVFIYYVTISHIERLPEECDKSYHMSRKTGISVGAEGFIKFLKTNKRPRLSACLIFQADPRAIRYLRFIIHGEISAQVFRSSLISRTCDPAIDREAKWNSPAV